MATNHYFNNFGADTADQKLIENIIIESIQTYGIDVYYMPRTQVNTDSIFGEDRISKFEDARQIEMYIKSVDGFEGDGTFVSNFGLEVRDQITFTVARRRFQELQFEGDNRDKEPKEGDLVYFPLTESLFQIMHVQGYNTFYQTGALQTFDLVCELFEYADEAIDTGIDELDKIEREESYTIEFTLGSGSGTYNVGENVYQGTSGYANSSIKGEVSNWDSGTSTLKLINVIGTFSTSDNIYESPYSIQLEDDSTLLLDDGDTSTPNSSTEGKPIWESTASFAISTFDDQEQSTDPSANNVAYETAADSIIDFTEGNPFSEGNI